jgi:acetyl esterase/lipase
MPLPPERAGMDAPPELAARRAMMQSALDAGLMRVEPAPEEIFPGGVRALRFASPKPARGVVLHLHGGGYRMGCPEAVGRFAQALAEHAQVDVICPAYRLAPEHPFPAALHDIQRVLTTLQPNTPLIVSGDSAGGGLAAVTTALACAEGKAPAALILLSGWLDLTVTNPSYQRNAATDPLFSRASAEDAAALYLQGERAEQPLVTAVHGSLAGFPPTFISFGTGEVLADDSVRFHEALVRAGVATRLSAIDGMEHVAVTRSFDLTGARETFAEVCAFVDEIVGA